MAGINVKVAAELLKLPKSTLRYYDNVGLLKPSREENGYRSYSESDLQIIKYIIVMKYGEFNLEEMQTIVKTLQNEPISNCKEKTEQLIKEKRQFFQEKINYYREMLLLFDKIPEIKEFEKAEEREIDDYLERIYQMILRGNR